MDALFGGETPSKVYNQESELKGWTNHFEKQKDFFGFFKFFAK